MRCAASVQCGATTLRVCSVVFAAGLTTHRRVQVQMNFAEQRARARENEKRNQIDALATRV